MAFLAKIEDLATHAVTLIWHWPAHFSSLLFAYEAQGRLIKSHREAVEQQTREELSLPSSPQLKRRVVRIQPLAWTMYASDDTQAGAINPQEMADVQISDKVAAVPESTVDHGKEPDSSQQEVVVAPVSSKKQSLSDIFTIVIKLSSAAAPPA